MSLLSIASDKSLWRGYEYYRDKKVLQAEVCGETEYKGVVAGSDGAKYDVLINIAHPRRSKCSCPYAQGRQVICKHKVALYFTIFSQEADAYIAEVEARQKEEEACRKAQEEQEQRVIDFVYKMKKPEAQEALLQLLFNGPAWQYGQFLEEYMKEEYMKEELEGYPTDDWDE